MRLDKFETLSLSVSVKKVESDINMSMRCVLFETPHALIVAHVAAYIVRGKNGILIHCDGIPVDP